MDFSKRDQLEENHRDLSGPAARHRINEMIGGAPVCFFCTAMSSGASLGTRPMSVLEVDAGGNLWFLSASDSHKNQEIAVNPQVNLYFQGSHSDFLYLKGRATIVDDKNKVLLLWKFILKNWFTGGVNDPRITAIRVAPEEGYYWDNQHGSSVAGIKILPGSVLGRNMDDSIEGKVLPN